MKTLFYHTTEAERSWLLKDAPENIDIKLIKGALCAATVFMAKSFDAISIGFSDDASGTVLNALYEHGIRYITLRAANNKSIDLQKANDLGMIIAHVPFGSPILTTESFPELSRYMVDVTFYNLGCYKKDVYSGNELTHTNDLGPATVYFR